MKSNYAIPIACCMLIAGCQVQPPSGSVIQPPVLGTMVDEINLRQEENAEYAKFIVYQHEFEINLQDELEVDVEPKQESAFAYRPVDRIRGYRLTPDGESHVSQLARLISNFSYETLPYIVVEQSNTSKRWDTKHKYPVHGNDELDAIRRQVVVNSLLAMGIENADQLVIVAPTYPAGLDAQEAASAYQGAIFSNGARSGGAFGR